MSQRKNRQRQWIEDINEIAHEIGYNGVRDLCTQLCLLAATDWIAWAILRNTVRRKLKRKHRQRLREKYPSRR